MRARNRILLAAVLLGLAAIAAWLILNGLHNSKKPTTVAQVPVHVITAQQQDLPQYVQAIGTVQSQHSVQLRPQVEAVLQQILVKEGDTVKRGQLLATLDDRAIRASLDQALAQKQQTQAQLRSAQADLGRYQELLKDQGVSRQQYEQQAATVGQLQASLAGNDATIAAAQVQLSYTRILSPLDGRVGIRNLDAGNLVRSSDTTALFSVTRLAPIDVVFALDQRWLPTLQDLMTHGAQVPVQVYAGTADAGRTHLADGVLRLFDNQVSSTTGTLRAKAEFANADLHLWPGQLVSVRLRTGLLQGKLVVPNRVVQRGLEQPFVYRLTQDGKVDAVNVKVLYQDDERSAIDGVDVGDKLIVDGQSRLKPGIAVKVLESDAAQAEARP